MINSIICTLKLDYAAVEHQYKIDPKSHFADAIKDLTLMASDGLVEVDGAGIQVTPTGRFFLRNLCMPFDAYLGSPTDGPIFSRTV